MFAPRDVLPSPVPALDIASLFLALTPLSFIIVLLLIRRRFSKVEISFAGEYEALVKENGALKEEVRKLDRRMQASSHDGYQSVCRGGKICNYSSLYMCCCNMSCSQLLQHLLENPALADGKRETLATAS